MYLPMCRVNATQPIAGGRGRFDSLIDEYLHDCFSFNAVTKNKIPIFICEDVHDVFRFNVFVGSRCWSKYT